MSDCNKARKELKLTSSCCYSCHEDFDAGDNNLCTIETNGKSYEVCCDLWDEFHARNRFPTQTNSKQPDDKLKQLLEKAYLAGFNATGEGYNGEYPFRDKDQWPDDNADWCQKRDEELKELLEETNG